MHYKNWAKNQVPKAFGKPMKAEVLKPTVALVFTAIHLAVIPTDTLAEDCKYSAALVASCF
jgi:hypothetical protein